MPVIDLLRRLFGLNPPAAVDASARDAPVEVVAAPPEPAPEPGPEPAVPIACPSCAHLIDPPPVNTRLCPHCRRRVVVRHLEGRLVYLTEATVVVFEAERRREADERAWTAARRRWLELAATVGAPPARRARLADAPVSEAAVEAARTLYVSAADRAAREARREKHWGEVGKIRGQQATALYADAGSPMPPPDDLVALYREGRAAVLRSLAAWAPDTELVGIGCCRACREDDGKAFRIAAELRTPRLPHAGCPRGLCPCDWWIAVEDKKKATRRRRSSPTRAVAHEPARASEPVPDEAAVSDGGDEPEPGPEPAPEPDADPEPDTAAGAG